MITIQGTIPRQVAVACSGGVDSMAVVDFLSSNHNLMLVFVHHGTETSEQAYDFVSKYSIDNNLPLYTKHINTDVPKGVSQEEHWRNERYDFFHSIPTSVITCHHLDDCVETWVWSSLHGQGKIIPYKHGNVIRPFRLNKKQEFLGWAHRHNVPWVEDQSNKDTCYMRNHIRHNMMPDILKVNPGIHKTIRKKVQNG